MEYHRLSEVLPNQALTVTTTYGNKKIYRKSHKSDNAHIHDYCEIYYNISGDVSFAVEGNIYPVSSGDLIVTKPNEIHYCIYNSDNLHEYYCIWLNSCEEYKYLLSPILNRESGKNAKISLDGTERVIFNESVEKLCKLEKERNLTSTDGLSNLGNILRILNNASTQKYNQSVESDRLSEILMFIDKNFAEKCTVQAICSEFYLSRSTLSRIFSDKLDTTPSKYIENRRLAYSKQLLSSGSSVMDAYEKSGFPDYSHFISLFKKRFGVTPLRFKKTFIK